MRILLIMLFLITLVSMSFGATPVIAFQPQPEPPGRILSALEKLDDLKEEISDAVDNYPTSLTDTNTQQQANALYKKIDVVIGMVGQGSNYMAAIKKLGNDISPKLAEPSGKPAEFKSWLSKDPALESVVEEFAETCQNLIEDIIMYLA